MRTTPELENQNLQDIQEKTGYSFSALQRIDLNDERIAVPVLSVLATWVSRVPSHYRSEIYFMLGFTEFGRPWFEDMLRWWQAESWPEGKSQLTRLIIHYMRDEDGVRVLEMCRDESFPDRGRLLTRLAKIPELRETAIDLILKDLSSGRYDLEDFKVYAQLDDARVRQYLVSQTASTDPRIRALADRLFVKDRTPPSWITEAAEQPDRTCEIYSSEVDLDDVDRELSKIATSFGLPKRRLGSRRYFLASADRDQWFFGCMGERDGTLAFLWLRAEDEDVVEIIVTTCGKKQ